jgi:hypothetical protein
MFSSLANYFTRTRIEKDNPKRSKQFLNWDKVDKIVLIIDNSSPINKNEIDKFIDGTKKDTDVFFIESKSKQTSYSDWRCFIKKDKSFLGLPAEHIFRELKSKKYNLVINAAFGNTLYAANLISSVQSDFKCGACNLYGELDLIIDKNNQQNLVSYLKEVVRYLQMIRTV